MLVWYGTNEYNFEKMPNPPSCEPAKCAQCGQVIVLADGGYSHGPKGYTCMNCLEEEDTP